MLPFKYSREDVEVNGNTASILEIEGALETANVDKFEPLIQAVVDTKPGYILVDLTRCSHLVSHAWGTLIYQRNRCLRDLGIPLVICGLQKRPMYVYRQLGFDVIIEHFKNRKEALAYLKNLPL